MKRNKKPYILIMSIISTLIFLTGFMLSDEKVLKIPKFSRAPKIDGVLDNPLWEKEALKIENFVQFQPKEGAIPSERTVVYLGYDEKNFYCAVQCFDSEPQKIRASLTNRDRAFNDDWILIFLDTFNEKRRAFEFFVNPMGIQGDGIRTEEGGNENDSLSWDTVFYTDGKLNEEGYVVEMAIPFKSIRFPNIQKKIWGIFIIRNIPRKGEIITFPIIKRGIGGLITQEAQIMIEGNVERGKNLEVMPVFTSLKNEGKRIDPEAGVNLKYGLSSDLTFDFTFNPDFSHIEADAPQIDINQRFALYYPEKRPFFLEGNEIFQFGSQGSSQGINIIYTRRIIDPRWGGKFTGKVGRFTLGYISALDQNPTESLWEVHNGGKNLSEDALFNIFRMKTDVFKESYIGFAFTDKEIDGSFNRVGSIDGKFKFSDNFFFSFQAVGAKTKYRGDETGLAPAFSSKFFYTSKHWGSGIEYQSIHPDFQASSGFVNRVDYRTIGTWIRYTLLPEKKFFNSINFSLNMGKMHDYAGNVITDQWTGMNINVEFSNFNRIFMNFSNYMERYGGINFKKNRFKINSQSNFIRWLNFSAGLSIGDSIKYDPENPFLGWSFSPWIWLNFRPNTQLQAGLSFNKNTFWEKRGGKLLWDYNVLRQITTYQISKTLSLRTIIDYNHYYKKLYGSFLLSYILRPGTVFFLGYDDNFRRDEFGSYVRTNRTIFMKFSYWWRV